jgi:hypothetical protein
VSRLLDLALGAALVLDGTEWTVEHAEPHLGRVVLRNGRGERLQTTMRFLMHHPDCHPASRPPQPAPPPPGARFRGCLT